jgi:hypothetical protein
MTMKSTIIWDLTLCSTGLQKMILYNGSRLIMRLYEIKVALFEKSLLLNRKPDRNIK